MATSEARQRSRNVVAAGRDAIARGAFEEARELFLRALDIDETPDALEGLADAGWWLHDETTTFAARERAFRIYRQDGDRQAAARVATQLANDSIDFRGEPAVANGWLQRAHRLLEGLESSPEYGWLTLWEGHLALMLRNDTEAAREKAGAASVAGRRLALTDLEMTALAVEGLALVSEGSIKEGLALLDEAATAAIAGEMSDLNAIGTILCYLMDACDRVRDYDRAAQWCERIKELTALRHFNLLYSVCRPHYAVVLMWRGIWDEAETQLTAAERELLTMRPPMAVEATVRLAELRWRQGHWDEAAALFARVEHEGLAQLGRAELALSQEDALTAADLADRYLRRIPAHDRMERGPGLELMVRARIALGDTEGAATALSELQTIASVIATRPLQASAISAEGLLASAKGDHETARRHIEDAVDLLEQEGAPFETARARLELARTLGALGRASAAAQEAQAALQAFRRVGAAREVERAVALLQDVQALPESVQASETDPAGLTSREIEVLRLIAAGKSNQEIATELVLSIRTVERHISNIFEKIGVHGKAARAAATAYAMEHSLISSFSQETTR